MSSALEMLQADLKQEKETARQILDAADAEGRPISDTERETFEGAMEKVTELKSRIEAEQDKQKFREKVDNFESLHMATQGLGDNNPVREPAEMQTKARSIGEALVYSESMRAVMAKAQESGKAPHFVSTSIEVPYQVLTKAAGDVVAETDNTALFGTGGNSGAFTTLAPLETPGFLQPRLTVADLIPSVPVTVGNSVTYPVVNTRGTIASTPQTEASAKEAGEYDFTIANEFLETIAGWVKISAQFLEDAPGLVAYINQDLPYQVRFNEETRTLAALYSAAGAADAHTGGSSGFDAILDAITTIQMDNANPTAIVIHPSDWAILRAEKFTNNGYVGGGPFTPTDNPWGLRVVVTPNATFGAPLVGDFSRARMFRRGGLTVASTNADGTDFQKNVITIRAELRSVVGVTYPEAFVEASVSS